MDTIEVKSSHLVVPFRSSVPFFVTQFYWEVCERIDPCCRDWSPLRQPVYAVSAIVARVQRRQCVSSRRSHITTRRRIAAVSTSVGEIKQVIALLLSTGSINGLLIDPRSIGNEAEPEAEAFASFPSPSEKHLPRNRESPLDLCCCLLDQGKGAANFPLTAIAAVG